MVRKGISLGTEVEDALLALPSIECVHIDCWEGVEYKQRRYAVLAHVRLVAADGSIPVVIGVPWEWKTLLFDFFLADYSQEFSFIPHVGSDGKICLLDLDLVLIDPSAALHELIAECVDRVVNLIEDGISLANRNDFIDEFESYWERLPSVGRCLLDTPLSEKSHVIQFVSLGADFPHSHTGGKGKRKRKKGDERKKDSASTANDLVFAAANSISLDNNWGWSGTVRNGVYFVIRPENPLYPPDFRCALSVEYIDTLLIEVPAAKLDRKIKKCKAPFVAVFNVIEPIGKVATIAVLIQRGAIVLGESSPCLQAGTEVLPLWVKRVDRETLMGRVSNSLGAGGHQKASNPFDGKNVLLVGCGSIGGYVSVLLAKSGCANLTLVDPDIFSEENIFRHALGKESVGKKKAVALKDYLDRSLPGLKIASYSSKIENIARRGEIDLHSFDVVISAVGNNTINLALDRMLSEGRVGAEAFYAWNEPLDLGCHAAFIPGETYSTPYCLPTFEALFAHDSEGFYELTSYCDRGQRVDRRLAGCGSSYVPYGADVSVRSALIVVDLAKRALSGNLRDAVVVSEKGEGYWFGGEGLRTSPVYDGQDEVRACKRLSDFVIRDAAGGCSR